MRLDKFIATATDYSRSESKRLIKQGLITINGSVAINSDQKIADSDQVFLSGEPLATPQPRYFMFHKPVGVVCSNFDSESPIVSDYLNEPNRNALQIVGRLDKDTTGLVLLTDDGQWNHAVTAPSRHCEKIYLVTLDRPLESNLIQLFAGGLKLDGETKETLPAKLTIINPTQAILAIQEGKYHQVKRMFAACGNHVSALHRSQIGAITLDSNLKPGEYRNLTKAEVNSFV